MRVSLALIALIISGPAAAMSFQATPHNADGTSKLVDPDQAGEAMAPRNPYDGTPHLLSPGDRRTFDSRSDPNHVDRSAPRDSSPLLWLYGK